MCIRDRYWTGGKTGPRFIRPIRWIVALLGDQVIPLEVAGVRSTNITRGHRILGSSSIPVTAANYEAELRMNLVILSAHERRHKIEAEASKLGAKIDTDLLETLTFITEYPTAIRGDFDPAYLELPAEAVSYTHLDVYKRQMPRWTPPSPPLWLKPEAPR